MAANYWDSTQKKFWTFSKKELADIRRALENENSQVVSQYQLPDRRLLNIYFSHRRALPRQ
jgi:cyclin C